MKLTLSSPITDIARIGPAKAKFLHKLGITHARDFLYTFPRRYDDFSQTTPINELVAGETHTVHGRIKSVKQDWGFRGRRRLLRIFVTIEDNTGTIDVTWYNLRFLAKQLWQGRELFIAGKVEENTSHKQKNLVEPTDKDEKSKGLLQPTTYNLQPSHRMRSPVIEFADAGEQTHTGRITPIYPETYGVTSRFLRYHVKNLLPLITAVPEYLPADIRQRHQLIGIHDAVKTAHFPSDTKTLAQAQRRLRFDELFFLQLAALVRRRRRLQRPAHAIPRDPTTEDNFISSLLFTLTGAQTAALEEILSDVAKNEPMNRLLQGDVGSGKSIIALAATHQALTAGFTVLYLAPTEILARQQAAAFQDMLGRQQVALLLGATKHLEKRAIKERLASSEPLCVIGTHALIQEDVTVAKCALAIIDEQHRFGVTQRQALQAATQGAELPHLLSMTATPIPRTLNLTVYGDLDVSTLNELPPGRQPVITKIVAPPDRDNAIIHILKELHAGRQGYVIAPLVEQSDKLEAKSAKETAAEMAKLFPDIAIGLLHGKMPSDEKEQVINNFNAGALQLLVATAVVEVGINVPNATIMIIEGAERFGLAQLHQFRGRIGRGQHQSYCYLFPTTAENASSQRLQVLAKTTDGFIIAEEDLKLRGPGEVYGAAQSGFSDLQVASLLDYDTIKRARQEAEQLLQQDPELTEHPILQKKVEQKNLIAHFE